MHCPWTYHTISFFLLLLKIPSCLNPFEVMRKKFFRFRMHWERVATHKTVMLDDFCCPQNCSQSYLLDWHLYLLYFSLYSVFFFFVPGHDLVVFEMAGIVWKWHMIGTLSNRFLRNLWLSLLRTSRRVVMVDVFILFSFSFVSCT